MSLSDLKVGELAKRGNVTAETVRHYTREGLLSPQRHPDNGYQLYSAADLERLHFIQRARKPGEAVPVTITDESCCNCSFVYGIFPASRNAGVVAMKIQEIRTGASSRWLHNDEMKSDESNWNCRIFSCLENRPMSAAGI